MEKTLSYLVVENSNIHYRTWGGEVSQDTESDDLLNLMDAAGLDLLLLQGIVTRGPDEGSR